jgi:outer membrane receptor protein involved in Fe transport
MLAPSSFLSGVAMFRPDYLLGSAVVEYFGIGLVESTETDPAFTAQLETQAAYAQIQTEIAEGLELSIGARYEQGEQTVAGLQNGFHIRGRHQPRQRLHPAGADLDVQVR